MLNILIVDDHPLMAAALADVLRNLAPQVTCVVAPTGTAAMQQVLQGPALDLMVLDLGLPDTDGFDLLARLRARAPATPMVIVSASDNPQDMHRALAAGALGFIAKSTPAAQFIQMMRQVLHGELVAPGRLEQTPAVAQTHTALPVGTPLNARQMDVLRLICVGKSNKYIAQEINVAEKTVKGRVTEIFKALGVVNRTQAALKARELGWLEPAASGAWSDC